MEKQEAHNIKFPAFKLLKEFILFPAILLVFLACEQSDNGSANIRLLTADSTVVTVEEPPNRNGREAILIKGNDWISGIPGFEENSFPTLSGEYRLRTGRTDGGNRFFVYLSSERLYFSAEWQPGREIGNIQIFQRSTVYGFMVAGVLDDGHGVFWTAVFLFPLGREDLPLSDDAFDQMLRAWFSKLLYFLSLARTPAEISVPAVVEF